MKSTTRLLSLTLLLLLSACRQEDDRTRITLWHQMVPAERAILDELIKDFSTTYPEYEVRALYKETEELRSGFQAAALAGSGPELVYGPSDVMGPFQTMGIVRDMSPWLSEAEQAAFVEGALTWLPDNSPDAASGPMELLQVGDRIGNHLALVYNRNFISEPPATTDDLVRLAVENTVDEDGDGRPDRYGLVWNFTEPFFIVPFLTGYGAWLFESQGSAAPDLDTPEAVNAYNFVLSLRDTHKVIPGNCDYEMADALFKAQRSMLQLLHCRLYHRPACPWVQWLQPRAIR
jgi:arabinogalactan oligomer/maltooligosaccharide transport system permease protein